MVEYRCSRRSRDMVPIMRDVEISKFAESVLRDYRPECLTEPTRFDPYEFAEQYIGANVEVMDIFTENADDFIAGAAVFKRQRKIGRAHV